MPNVRWNDQKNQLFEIALKYAANGDDKSRKRTIDVINVACDHSRGFPPLLDLIGAITNIDQDVLKDILAILEITNCTVLQTPVTFRGPLKDFITSLGSQLFLDGYRYTDTLPVLNKDTYIKITGILNAVAKAKQSPPSRADES